MNPNKLWQLETKNEVRNRTWSWWWWLFFFENRENPLRTKQLMLLWATRNTKKVKINEYWWKHGEDRVLKDHTAEFDGLAGAWYFDGKEMIEPLYTLDGRIKTAWGENSGILKLYDETNGGEKPGFANLSGKGDVHNVHIKRDGVEISLSMTHWNPWLSRIVSSGRNYLGNLGYEMHKIRGVKASGTVKLRDGAEEEVNGTAYLQKVRIHSPTSPWYWGIFHCENGSYMDYFMPHLGLPMFRRKKSHKSVLDGGEKILSKVFQFYDSETDELHQIKNIKISKSYENDLPVFLLQGSEEGTGKSFRLRMKAYSRATWRVQQPLLGIFSTILHYNEYPVNVIEYEFDYGKGRGRKVKLEDLGHIDGNCEHAWGIV